MYLLHRAAYYTEQLLHRAASCKILELLEHLSMAVSIAIFSSDAKKIRTSWRAIPKYYFFRRTTWGVGGRPPLSFFENREKCPDFGKKTLIVSIFWVKYSIQNEVLRVSRKKNSKIFICGAFSCVSDEVFTKVPWFHETSPAPKYFWLSACLTATVCEACLWIAVEIKV